MKTTVKVNSKITLVINYTSKIIERMPWGLEPLTIKELYEETTFEFHNPTPHVLKSDSIHFHTFRECIDPTCYCYDARMAKAYAGRTDIDYICFIDINRLGVTSAEKELIEKSVIKLKYRELQESGNFEFKQNQMIAELQEKLKPHNNKIKHGDAEIERKGHLMTDKEIKRYTINYNNTYNEGYQESLPFILISVEEYNFAKKEITRLEAEIANVKEGILF